MRGKRDRNDGLAEAPLFGALTGVAQVASAPETQPPPHHVNHRARLRDRFDRAGPGALADYEMLELILFRAIPRRDVKPLAKQLLAEFGDFNHTISAPMTRLLAVSGMGETAAREFKIVEAAAHRLAQAKVLNRPVITSWDALLDYCKTAMAHRDTEQFRILFLDRKNVLIADEPQARGTVDHVPVYPREVAKRTLELNASAIIMVHNHPSGDPTPSKQDIEMTRMIEAALSAINVKLHDHLVIGKDTNASFRSLSLI